MLLSSYSDHLRAGAARMLLPARPMRVLYCASRDALDDDGKANQFMPIQRDGATRLPRLREVERQHGVLRWELAHDAEETSGTVEGIESTLLLRQQIDLDDHRQSLVRCDRVDFPPGGIAYTHTHAGPGIRCLLSGALKVTVESSSRDIAPGVAWFESGPDPVLATASQNEPTAFARLMILPVALKGKSSIHYVKLEDVDRPKTQKYEVFIDEPLVAPGVAS